MAKRYFWAKEIYLKREKAWGENHLDSRREMRDLKWSSVNPEQESSCLHAEEYVKLLTRC
jgi:hypothetical protein